MAAGLPPLHRLANKVRARQSFSGSFSESVLASLPLSESGATSSRPLSGGASTGARLGPPAHPPPRRDGKTITLPPCHDGEMIDPCHDG